MDIITRMTKDDVVKRLGDSSPAIKYPTYCQIELISSNVNVTGNYLKYSRSLCQTPWEVDGKKLYPTS